MTRTGTLQIVNRAVAFQNSALGKTSALEMAVDIAREHKKPVPEPLGPPQEHLESRMRSSVPVKIVAMAEEAPGQLRVAVEPAWVRHFGKAPPSKRRIG